jgi:hypothetical protein
MNKHGQVEWFKYERLVFSCLKRYLKSEFSSETDVLTLLAISSFFHSLGENSLRNQALTKLHKQINDFGDIADSGMQLRNCLAIAAYSLISDKASQDFSLSSQIVESYFLYAEERNWFGDPRLPALVARLHSYKQYSSVAYDYLHASVSEWIERDKVLGVICYCLVEQHDIPDDICNYLCSKNWQDENLETLTWALLAIGNLLDIGYRLQRVQYLIVEQIYEILWETDIIRSVTGNHKRKTEEFTSFEIAFALFALKHRELDQIIGFPMYQQDVLISLIQLRQKLLNGAVVLSRRWLFFFQITAMALILVIGWVILQQLEIQDLYSVFLEIIVGAVLWGLGRWYFNKGLPATETLSEIFGAEIENWSEDVSNEQSSTA